MQEWNGLVHHHIDDSGDQWFEPLKTETEPEVSKPRAFNVFVELDSRPDPWDEPETPPVKWVTAESWATSKCLGCQRSTVWHDEKIIYPSARVAPRPNADMPSLPCNLYEEAAAVMQVSRRAGAAMARATLERLLIELDPMDPGKVRLDERIVHVIPRVSSSLGDALTVIRHVGNKALHVADTPDDALVLVLDDNNAEIVELIFNAINDVVDELVTKPRSRERLLNAVPAAVIEEVERKRAAAATVNEPSE